MLDTRVKICGITTPDDASLCLTHGADYLGLIFAPSPRQINNAQAKAIREAAPDAMLVGVFQNASVAEVADAAGEARLNLIQLHGDETPEYCDVLSAQLSLPIIKKFSASGECDMVTMREYQRTSYFLFDLDKAPRGNHRNGAERAALWKCAASMRRKGYRIFLAGALNPLNVRDAIEHVEPYGIDVASGVELEPGVKDSAAVESLIKAVRQ